RDRIGMARVTTVMAAATPANSITRKSRSVSLSIRFTAPASEIEIDHFAHGQDSAGHPARGKTKHDLAQSLSPEGRDIVRAYEIDEKADDDRQKADDPGGGLGLHAHRLDLVSHLGAFAQHIGEIAERFRQIAARFRLDGDDDRKEVDLRQTDPLV